jgi:GT2 family glycosyltransferase
MFFSVIIPTCNRNDLLAKCLARLQPDVQTLKEVDYEIIVTDDSAGEGAAALIAEQFPFVQWAAGPRRGPAANRNNGARLAKGEWLVFLDDDVIPDFGLLSAYYEKIKQLQNFWAFEGAILPDDWSLLQKDLAECPVNTRGNCFWSANICVQRNLFDTIGGFDENFLIAAQEDQDLYRRLKPYTEIYFIENAIVIHPVRFIHLNQKIKSIPQSVGNWYKYKKKYNNFFLIFAEGVISQTKACIQNIITFKIKSVCYNLLVLNYFIFFMIIIKFRHE